MRVEHRGAPFIHHHESARGMMVDILLALMVVYAICYYYYGPRAVILGLVGAVSALLAEWASVLLAGRRVQPRDLSPLVTGMLLPLLMPASIDLYVPVLACVFAMIVVKAPFGGSGHNIFNPAAAGFAFVAICFPVRIFDYPLPLTRLPVFPVSGEFALGTSPALTLNIGGIPQYDLVEMLLGNHPGPMGATNILVILACLLYLIFRGVLRWEIPAFFLLTCAAFAYWFPRSPLLSGMDSLMYEMMSGMLLFGGVFMLGDPVTTPKREWAKVFYAVVAGASVTLFRRLSNLEEGFPFALLGMNATVWGIDVFGEHIAAFIRRKRLEALDRQEVPKNP